jgi:hypothetical protein
MPRVRQLDERTLNSGSNLGAAAGTYFHAVFTVPLQLNPLFLANPSVMH